MNYINLRVPVYDIKDGSTTDEPITINTNYISEILPREYAGRKRGEADGWNTMLIMTNGNEYRIVEDPKRVIELIAAQ